MNPEAFKAALAQQGIDLTDLQMQQFETYYQLLVSWNEKINLTAITDRDEVYLKHFYDSLTLAFALKTDFTGKKLVDVGSGAGFPSIPLKIAFPQLEVSIVDSLNKRIKFIDTVTEELGLAGVFAYHDRAEDFGQNKAFRGQFDLATARAVARLSVLSEYCLPLVKKGGLFVAMKAAKADEEIAAAKKAIATLGGKFSQDLSLELPDQAGERHLLVIEKRKETPNKYPRKAGLPNKKPIQ
ncbi:16S rRNA (guanine(527)-N(7))-methyltransferase RsmG [Aerococcus loyolae]|uniref:Ribosomal RNA small subunit methyltransferase G n=1 Tax=Aerococcus urinae TaxID=1376 RepID=A0A2I1L6U5_9LACT|nr:MULTISPECIES: 16S rRNA (guanine(527)-N(7))-methyltransferase RsmG [Aerococcus]MDK6727897.1 16S rRNA (guanine(527)-N(7))-methyltransferase RsmG [Aerococcus urinae]MDK7910355.1 16S rRNA (guanine(527)-N(7))-methyltransferase RsmG [Aerococcus urinae]MDK8610086.1 16S rRNA (guanine(527)-N(7))-methyltransferase RsmG [Aerococcus urinae]MDL5183084.1 16S rRNA (guanine(527)-N(7))-methyltransferase RsmG [Aerococcus loyolae]OFL16001.1 16S rRNA methyltransferase G [Aerococcus loyolae]